MNHMQKIMISLYSVLLFVLVSLPWTYRLTDKMFGRWFHTSDAHGCPTTAGLVLHSIVFFLLVLGSMYVPWKKMY